MKKLIILISVIITFFVFFLYMYFSPRDYQKQYKIDKINITEKYNKKNKYYYFNFEYKNKNFEYVSERKYTTKRGLINDINIKKDKEVLCIIPKSEYFDTYPLCYKDNEQISYTMTPFTFEHKKKVATIADQYKDITINYLNNKKFLIWNYKGFNILDDEEKKTINFLDNDSYKLDLVAKVDKYLLVPNYNSEHTFNKIYIIDTDKNKLDTWELDYEIYFNSYILGTHKKSVYLYDKKNQIEYELRPDKKKIKKVKYKALIENEWQKLELSDLNKEIKFKKDTVYNYEVINNKLYISYLGGNNKIQISKLKVKDIVYIDNDVVYYLVDDKLYMYDKLYGEVLLLNYFEWNFNYKNMIYIY